MSSPFSLAKTETRTFLEPTPGDNSPAPFTLPTYRQETLRHILLGDYGAVTDAIRQLIALGYSDKVAWSDPIPTRRSGEYLAVMTRRRGMGS